MEKRHCCLKNLSEETVEMIHPATEVRYIDEEKGYGLFATSFIPKGTVTWVRDQLDREFSVQELAAFPPALAEMILHFSYRNCRGNYIFCWDNARYTNHETEPNTCITAYETEIAIRDILADEEVTNHYGMLNIVESFVPYGCDQPVGPDDLVIHAEEWDQKLQDAFPWLTAVDQPLRKFVEEKKWALLEKISRRETEMKSVASCHYGDCRRADHAG